MAGKVNLIPHLIKTRYEEGGLMYIPSTRKLGIIVVAAVLLTSQTGCQGNPISSLRANITSSESSTGLTNKIDNTGRGNTPGNLANLGVVCQTDSWIY